MTPPRPRPCPARRRSTVGDRGQRHASSLTWSAPASDGGATITGYKIYRGTSSGGETLLTTVGNVTSYKDTRPSNGTTYYYKVAAVNAVGEGALSNERSATPAAPRPCPARRR